MGPVGYCQIKQQHWRNLSQLIRNHILERTHQFTKVFCFTESEISENLILLHPTY